MIDCFRLPADPAPAGPCLIQTPRPLPLDALRQAAGGANYLFLPDLSAPDGPETAQKALDAGARGLGPFRLPPDDAALASYAALCAERGAILSLWAPPPVGQDGAPLTGYLALAAAYPALRLVLSDFGGGLAWYTQMRATARESANIYFGSWSDAPLDLARALSGLPPGHVVYGSAGQTPPDLPCETWAALDAAARGLLEGETP